MGQYLSLLQDYLSSLGPIVQTVLFVVSSYLLAKIILRILSDIATKTSNFSDDYLILHLKTPLLSTSLLFSFYAGIKEMKNFPIEVIWSIVLSIIVIHWSFYIKKVIRYYLVSMSKNHNKESVIQLRTIPLFQNIGIIAITILSVYFIFSAWNVDMTAWLASAGIIGIAVGFAAKDTLANLFSGVFILADAPYKIGDYIVLDSGERGKVTAIGIRSTRILTRDDVEITIPNSVMGNTKIKNESGGRHLKFRIRLKIGVAYGSDIDFVKSILMQISGDESMICSSPSPRLRLRNFGDSSVNFELLCWVDNPEFKGRAIDVLNTNIYKSFNLNNIEIPYPKRDVYLK